MFSRIAFHFHNGTDFLLVSLAYHSLEMFALSMENKIPQYSGEPCFKTRKGGMCPVEG